MGYIYKITSPAGKVYIGQTWDIEKRKSRYARMRCKGQRRLYQSLVEHGFSNHLFEVIESGSFSSGQLDNLERHFIAKYNTVKEGLNLLSGGKKGSRHAKETKLLMSESAKNRGSEWSKAISKANSERVISNATRQKMSLAKKGKPLTKEHAQKIKANIVKINWKTVLNLETGIYYENAKLAAEAYGMNHSTLKSRLNGSKVNRTSLMYA